MLTFRLEDNCHTFTSDSTTFVLPPPAAAAPEAMFPGCEGTELSLLPAVKTDGFADIRGFLGWDAVETAENVCLYVVLACVVELWGCWFAELFGWAKGRL